MSLNFCYLYFLKLPQFQIPRTRNFEPTSEIPIEEQKQQKETNFKMISELHSNEIMFYEIFTKHCQDGVLKIPKYYFGREMTETQEGLILMEDLSKKCSKQKFQGLQFLSDKQVSLES